MLNIAMICNLGMSTSMLVGKMESYAASIGIETKVEAMAYDQLAVRTVKTDIVLIGPQVRHLLKKFQDQFGGTIPVIKVMNMQDYALIKVDKIFDEAYAEYTEKTS